MTLTTRPPDRLRSRVPNKPKTPIRAVRISDDVWEALRAAAENNGETAADVLRRAAENYVRRNK